MPYDAKTLSAYTHTPNLTNDSSPRIVDCESCGLEYPIEQTQAIETHNATEETPAEYTTVCNACAAPSQYFAPARVSRYYKHYRGTVAVPSGPSLPDERQ